jgi:hypothetical protein
MLNFTGKLLRGSSAKESWIRGDGGVIRPPEVEKGREHLLSFPGVTDPGLRKAVEYFVVAQWGLERQEPLDLPIDLEPYLKKLSLHAYRILDEDIEGLQFAGYSQDMIYEITMVGAVGAALVGLEVVYQFLYG